MSPVFAGVLESELLPYLVLLVKATALLAFAGAVALALRSGSPAVRHLVWTLTVGGLLVLPLASWSLPDWRIAVVSDAAPVQPVEAATGALATPVGGSAAQAASPVEASALASESSGAAHPRGGRFFHRATSPAGLLFLWAAGSAGVLLWLLGGRIALRFVRRRAFPLEDGDWDQTLRDAAWLLEVGRPVRLYRSRTATMPVTWGVVRPVVLLPEGANAWSEDQRRAVLLHELAHVARRDCLTQLLAGIACAVYWFHPGVWYAARRMRVERERACDERVLLAGTPPADYAAHLLDLARHCRTTVPAPLVALHMARPSQLEGRLLAVLAGLPARRPPARLGMAAVTAAAVLLTLPLSAMQPAVAEVEPDQTSSQDEPLDPPMVASATPDEPAPALLDPPRLSPDTTPPAVSRPASSASLKVGDADSIARIVPRLAASQASYAIVTRSGQVALLLRDSTIVVQLTDRGLEEIGRTDARRDEDRGFLSTLFESMLRTGLRVLLDHGIEYALADLREARYEDGRLVLESRRGGDVFRNLDIDGRDVMADFRPRDARTFAARANAARPRP
jgi:beta-lactamase regulating signal transducer with metallopeptidase domain